MDTINALLLIIFIFAISVHMMCVQVYENGSYDNGTSIFFNLQQASRGVDAGHQDKLMERVRIFLIMLCSPFSCCFMVYVCSLYAFNTTSFVCMFFKCSEWLCGVFQLLDQCSAIPSLKYPKNNPAIRPLASRLFDRFGRDIKSVHDLEAEEQEVEVWLSFGEAWKNPFSKRQYNNQF